MSNPPFLTQLSSGASGDAWLVYSSSGTGIRIGSDRIGEYVLERGDELERAVRLLDRSRIDGPKPSTERQPARIPARINLDPLRTNDFQAGAAGLEPPTSYFEPLSFRARL